MFRRLFLYEETLNPTPAVISSALFFLFKNLTFWLLASVAIWVITRVKFPDRKHELLFQLGWIPLATLLLSPGEATYHFLLLAISAVFFVRILLDLGRVYAALGVAILFAAINLPHYLKLKSLAVGWLTPLAYTRLWLLALFFATVIVFFHRFLNADRGAVLSLLLVVVVLSSGHTLLDYLAAKPSTDTVSQIQVEGSEFQRQPGLIMNSPDRGRNKTVFSYCTIPDQYAIFSTSGARLTPEGGHNYYRPDLAPDDTRLLVETVEEGEHRILYFPRMGQSPTPLTRGRTPSWHPSGDRFVFEKAGKLYIFEMDTRRAISLDTRGLCCAPSYSPTGRFLIYCLQETKAASLRRLDLESGEFDTILRFPHRLRSPRLSPDETRIVFSAETSGNWDIWMFDLLKNDLSRVTWDPAVDLDTIRQEDGSGIVFASDRGRGLGCTALFEIPMAEQLP